MTAMRGEIWTWAGKGDYGKPRPVVIIQSAHITETKSVLIAGLSSSHVGAKPLLRPTILPTPANGLHTASDVTVDLITATPRHRLGERIGVLAADDLAAINQRIALICGLAD